MKTYTGKEVIAYAVATDELEPNTLNPTKQTEKRVLNPNQTYARSNA